jgi:hypothetical protein
MKMLECMVAWTPSDGEPGEGETAGDIKVGQWPDYSRWSDSFAFTDGACETHWHEVEPAELAAQIFILFNTIVVRDRIGVHKAHRAFLEIDEYRDRIVADAPRLMIVK